MNWVTDGFQVVELAEYTESLDELWDFEVCQLESTVTDTRCRFAVDATALLYEESIGAHHLQRGCLTGNHIVFAIPNEVALRGRWQGDAAPPHSLAFTHSNAMLDLVLPAGTVNRAAVLNWTRFANRFEALTGTPARLAFPRDRNLWVKMSAETLGALNAEWGMILWQNKSTAETLCDEVTDSLAIAWLAGQEPVTLHPRAAWSNFRRAMERCRTTETLNSPSALAIDLGISLRTLHNAFQSSVGVSPGRYLHRLRLGRVHEQLLRHGPGDVTVTELAAAEGITELGRFAVEYKKLFGDSPSNTLKRAQKQVSIIRPTSGWAG